MSLSRLLGDLSRAGEGKAIAAALRGTAAARGERKKGGAMTDGERGILKSIVRCMENADEDACNYESGGHAKMAAYRRAAEFESVLFRLKELLGEGEGDATNGE